jgi:hypothetical protein
MPGFAVRVPAAVAAAYAPRPAARTLHVLNGDATAGGLLAAGIAGRITLSADVLYEGPVTPTSSPERWRRERARFLAESGYDGYEECLARLTRWDQDLEDFRAYDEVVLWFEHDLFDQLHLCRLLAWFSARGHGLTRISLVQAGDHLGLMPPEQLAGLLDTRQPVTPAQHRLAAAAWAAFCAPLPARLEALLHADTSPLPYLAAAVRRHLEEFPGAGDGLSRTERQVLAALEPGPLAFPVLFAAVQRMEERRFMTDLSLLRRLRELAAGPRPPLHFESRSGTVPRLQPAALTPVGQGLLAGREDWIEIRGGIDRWQGGVHLVGPDAAWRWDRRNGRLVAAGGWR